MKRIASFCVDHNKLDPGIYISRQDGDITTYDLRLCKPNTPPFLEVPAVHTIEHLFATIARNSEFSENIIYFGPMGCRTGFYLLTRDLPDAKVIDLIKGTFRKIAEFKGEIPGTTAIECGNYLEHDLDTAVLYAERYCEIIKNWNVSQLAYQI